MSMGGLTSSEGKQRRSGCGGKEGSGKQGLSERKEGKHWSGYKKNKNKQMKKENCLLEEMEAAGDNRI